MSKGFEGRDAQDDSVPEFFSICGRILGTPEVFEMAPVGYKDKMLEAVEKAKGNRIEMAKCMRELQSMVFVLKTPIISNLSESIGELSKIMEAGEGYKAYKFLQNHIGKSDPDIEAASLYILEQESVNADVDGLMSNIRQNKDAAMDNDGKDS